MSFAQFSYLFLIVNFFEDFIYLFEKEHKQGEKQRQREKQAPR